MRYGNQNSRNFGYGKQLHYAAKQALKDSMKSHSSIATHSTRFKEFSKFCKNEKIHDARKITVYTVKQYAAKLKIAVHENKISVAYAQNLVSSVNVVMSKLREDNIIKVSPSREIDAKRSNIRTIEPLSLDLNKVEKFKSLIDERSGAVLSAARDLGLREREAVLMDYKQAEKELEKNQTITVTEGTKGGRGHCKSEKTIRVIKINDLSKEHQERVRKTIKDNAILQGEQRNLIKPGETFKSVDNKLHGSKQRAAFKEAELKAYHDARAAYACERYEHLTGKKAPVLNNGVRATTKVADTEARKTILKELGHGSKRELTAYIGSAK